MERRHLHNLGQELKGNICVFCHVWPVLPEDEEQQKGLEHLYFPPGQQGSGALQGRGGAGPAADGSHQPLSGPDSPERRLILQPWCLLALHPGLQHCPGPVLRLGADLGGPGRQRAAGRVAVGQGAATRDAGHQCQLLHPGASHHGPCQKDWC